MSPASITWLLTFYPEDVDGKFLKIICIRLEDYTVSQSRRLKSECFGSISGKGKPVLIRHPIINIMLSNKVILIVIMIWC